MSDVEELERRRLGAVELLRQSMREAGHVMYAAASDLARDRGRETVSRKVDDVTGAVNRIRRRVEELNEIMLRQNEARNDR